MNQPITGYRTLTEVELALVNEIKDHAEVTRSLVEKVRRYADNAMAFPSAPISPSHSNPIRWASEGQTSLQVGYMCLTRAVTQPTTF